MKCQVESCTSEATENSNAINYPYHMCKTHYDEWVAFGEEQFQHDLKEHPSLFAHIEVNIKNAN
jgi:hypothetical protein